MFVNTFYFQSRKHYWKSCSSKRKTKLQSSALRYAVHHHFFVIFVFISFAKADGNNKNEALKWLD